MLGRLGGQGGGHGQSDAVCQAEVWEREGGCCCITYGLLATDFGQLRSSTVSTPAFCDVCLGAVHQPLQLQLLVVGHLPELHGGLCGMDRAKGGSMPLLHSRLSSTNRRRQQQTDSSRLFMSWTNRPLSCSQMTQIRYQRE